MPDAEGGDGQRVRSQTTTHGTSHTLHKQHSAEHVVPPHISGHHHFRHLACRSRHGIAYAVARGNIEHSPARPCTHITRAGHPPHLVNALLPGFFQAPVPISHERKEALNDPKQRCPQCTSSCPAPTAPRSTSSSSRPSSSAPSPWLLCPARRRSPSLRWRAWRGGSLQDSPMWQRACSRRVARAWPRHGRHGAPSRSSRPVSAADRPRA